jgi:cytochrome o ubiquinol oxidase subunit 2
MLLSLGACAASNTHISFLDPQGPVATAQRTHFWWVLGILAIFVAGPILLLLPIFAWRYRYASKTARYTPRWDYSAGLEIMSWSGPVVIVAALAFFVWRDTHRLDPYKPVVSAQTPLRVDVIGYDWKWLFIYPDQGIASIGTLALPTGRSVTLHLTSATVMQSFFIPAMGSQIYAMGGMVTQLNLQADKVGISLGENTMYNGAGFHQQKFEARAMSPPDFEAWVEMVRGNGIALDGKTLAMVARRGSRDDLIASLPGAAGMKGDLYFTGLSKSLFSDVVMATMDAKPTLEHAASDTDPAAAPCAAAASAPGRSR